MHVIIAHEISWVERASKVDKIRQLNKEIRVPVRYPKEQMHRIKYTKLTPEQITVKLAAAVSGPSSTSPLV